MKIFTIKTNVCVVLIDLLKTKWRILNMMAQTFMGIWLHWRNLGTNLMKTFYWQYWIYSSCSTWCIVASPSSIVGLCWRNCQDGKTCKKTWKTLPNWCQKINKTCYVVCKSWPQVVQWPIHINVSSYHVWSRIQLVSSSTKPLLVLGSFEEQFVLQIAKFAIEYLLLDFDISE